MSKITQYVRHLAVVAIATLAAQCAWATTDENGNTPNYWLKFDGNLSQSGSETLSAGGNTGGGYLTVGDVEGNKAYIVGNTSQNMYGDSFSRGNGSFSIVLRAKTMPIDNGAIFTMGTASTARFVGLIMDGSNGIKLRLAGSSWSGDDAANVNTANGKDVITAAVSMPTTKFHTYVLVWDNDTKVVSLQVDNGTPATYTGVTDNMSAFTAGQWQFAAIHGAMGRGIVMGTGLVLDDFRLYKKALTADEVSAIVTAMPAVVPQEISAKTLVKGVTDTEGRALATAGATVKFLGDGNNGMSITNNATTASTSHYIFNGGTHALSMVSGNGNWSLVNYGEGDSAAWLTLENNATLTFNGKDVGGWNSSRQAKALIDVKSGSNLKMQNNGSNTFYFPGVIQLNTGSTMTIVNNNNNMRFIGGNDTDGIVVPAVETEGTATIAGAGKLTIAQERDGSNGTAINVGENATLNVTAPLGMSGTATLQKNGTGTLKLSGAVSDFTGTMIVNAGTVVFQNTPACALTVKAGATVELPGVPSTNPTVEEGGKIILNSANIGSLRVIPSWLSLPEGTTTIKITETTDEFTSGSVTVTGVPEGMTVEMFRADWTTVTLEAGEGNTASFSDNSLKVSGPAAWLDYTFTTATRELRKSNSGTIENAGSAGKSVGLTYDTNYNANNSYNEDNGTLLAKSTPWRGMSGDQAWPSAYTVAVCANVPDVEKGCLMAFGSSTSGNSYVAIVRGENGNQILLMKGTTTSAKATTIATMKANNATAVKHLIVFTNDGTTFKVYCDGELINSVAAITLGQGFQIGSVHGGVAPSASQKGVDYTGITRVSEFPDDKKDGCEISMIRVFNKVISDDEMAALAKDYAYVAQSDLYTREISANADISANAAWTLDGTTLTKALPEATQDGELVLLPSVKVTTTTAATLTLNADLETLNATFDGTSTLTIIGDGEHTLNVNGSVTVNAPIKVKLGEVNIMESPLTIGENGSIEIDVTSANLNCANIYTETKVQLTGLTTEAAGKITVVNGPTADAEHTVAVVFEDGQYWLKVSLVRTEATTLYVSGTVELGNDTLFAMSAEGESSAKRYYTDDVITLSGNAAITIPSGLAVAVNTIDIGANTLTITLGEGVACPKILGAGTIVMSQVPGRIFQDEEWTGVVYLKNVELTNWDLGAYGNNDTATIKLTGVTGYSKNGSSGNGCNAAVELADDDETKALTVTGGYSDAVFFFRKVTGSGTFTSTDANTSHQVYKFHDVSGFSGKIEVANNLRVVIGTGDADSEVNSLAFTNGVVINGGLNWTAAKVTFGDTLKVKGSVGDAIVTATTLPETMPAVTLVDEEGEHAGYTLVNDNGTLKVALATVTVTLPVPSNTEITSVTAGGETVTFAGGAITVAPGTEVVVTYAAIGNNIGGGTVTVTIDADTTTDSIDVSGITTVAAVAKIGDAKYETLVAALNAAAEGATITLVADDSSITTRYQLTKSVTINLNGKNVTASERIVVSNNAILTVNAEGSTISGLRIDAGKNSNNCGNVVINKGTWTIRDNTVVHVNGTCTNASVTIDGATITSEGDNGIQLNGKGTHTISDSTITGATAIYVKAGAVSITGCTISANGAKGLVMENNNGSDATGDAIVLDNCVPPYPEIVSVTIDSKTTIESANGSAVLSYARANNTRQTKILPAALKSNITEAIATSADLFDDYVEGPQSWTDVTEETKVTDIVSKETAEALEGSGVKASDIAAWASANEVEFTAGITIPVNALIFNVAPAAAPTAETEAAAADAILKDLASKVDITAMKAGTLDSATLALLEKEYPMATIKLVPSTKLDSTETAKFFQLSIELK